ncbi:MAG: glycosyltransferase [Sphingobacteriia bacterium]|nr:glycosyltransferase [Sphingobacteriia bacterium]NCC41105.1 glycosyltransferase [Gammaproteobacteria bacterium]
MRLSIIVPTLNEADTIGVLLADLAPLRAAGAELILADGGSSDPTREQAAGGVDRVLNTTRGRAAQMNAGARVAAGDLLWFLHADTRVPADAASALGAACAGDPCWGRFDVRLSGRHPLLRVVERGMNARSRLSGIATGDQGIFVTRALFDRVGGFPSLPLMEDIAISVLLRRIVPPVCLRARLVTSSRRWETRGILRTILLMWRLRLAYALSADPARLARRYEHGPPRDVERRMARPDQDEGRAR